MDRRVLEIGICSPVATALLSPWLDVADRPVASRLSGVGAPAVTTLVQEFLNLGHKIVLFTLDEYATSRFTLHGPSLTIYVAPANMRNRLMRRFDDFGYRVRQLRRMIREADETPDVISAHWTGDYALAALCFSGKCPIYVTVRDIMPYILSQNRGIRGYGVFLSYLKNEYLMRRKDLNFIANSEYTAERMQHYWGKSAPVIYNSIRDSYLECGHEERNDGKFRILTISVSYPSDRRKNIGTLIQAFSYVRSRHPQAELLLVGACMVDGNPVLEQWRSQGLMDGVTPMGNRSHDEVIRLLRQSDMMVHPSLEETFGNTLIEAMACGCPVVGGRESGAVPFVLEQGNAGYLTDVTDADRLAGTMIHVMSNRAEAAAKAEYARQRCRDKFSSRGTALEYLKLFGL